MEKTEKELFVVWILGKLNCQGFLGSYISAATLHREHINRLIPGDMTLPTVRNILQKLSKTDAVVTRTCPRRGRIYRLT